MNIIDRFGTAVGNQSLKDPEKARRLLLTGYRLQEKRLQFFSDRELPPSGQYVARVVMGNIIQSLVLYALKDFLIKRFGSLLEHTT